MQLKVSSGNKSILGVAMLCYLGIDWSTACCGSLPPIQTALHFQLRDLLDIFLVQCRGQMNGLVEIFISCCLICNTHNVDNKLLKIFRRSKLEILSRTCWTVTSWSNRQTETQLSNIWLLWYSSQTITKRHTKKHISGKVSTKIPILYYLHL